jgi:hypothetical protein
MVDRILPAHLAGHAPPQEECDDASEEGEEGRSKEGATLAYRPFQSFRQR